MDGTELIAAFVNTRGILDREEVLAGPVELAKWLEEHRLLPGETTATAGDFRRAIELREALRGLLLANTGLELDRTVGFAVLDAVARRARIELCFEECAGQLHPAAGGISAALGRIVIAVHRAMGDGSWVRLKACRASDCQWAFIDNAKNHSRSWCSMQVCGNREKARAFRGRRRVSGSSQADSS